MPREELAAPPPEAVQVHVVGAETRRLNVLFLELDVDVVDRQVRVAPVRVLLDYRANVAERNAGRLVERAARAGSERGPRRSAGWSAPETLPEAVARAFPDEVD